MSYAIKLLVVVFCGVALTTAESEFDKINRNSRFQRNFAAVAVKNQIIGAADVELKHAKTDAQKECIKNKKVAIDEEGEIIVDQIVGSIIPEIDQLVANGSESDKQAFVDRINYPFFKKNAIKELKKKLNTWVPEKQHEMSECLKTEECTEQ